MAQTIHLQGIGRVAAKAYGEMVPGDRIVFNYGSIYRVEAVRPIGRQSVEVDTTDERTGKTYTSRRGASSLIGIVR